MVEPLFRAPKGTRDILHPDSARARALVEVFAQVAEAAGYEQLVLPMMEHAEVFHRLGETTDIVTKEMFELEDRAGRRLALRPEQTASAARAFVEHHPTVPWKVWYWGPNFRAENVQRGRYRQFDQVGVEAFGPHDPQLDVEVVGLAWRFLRALGLSELSLLVNTLGDAGDRDRYAGALAAHFASWGGELSPESRATLERNPLRVLDSKRPEDADAVAAAPTIHEYLSPAAAEHFEAVLEGLRLAGVPFEVRPKLVRGLDYYVRTAFEIESIALDAAQRAVGGGGRFDGLVEQLGGHPTPGVGFAIGVDRTLLACDAEGAFPPPARPLGVFVVDTTGGSVALALTEELRNVGIAADRAFDGRSMKAQMKAADRSGARLALIVGSDEVAAGEVSVRDLRGDAGQVRVRRDAVVDEVRKRLP